LPADLARRERIARLIRELAAAAAPVVVYPPIPQGPGEKSVGDPYRIDGDPYRAE
jgi:hypothetical protein